MQSLLEKLEMDFKNLPKELSFIPLHEPLKQLILSYMTDEWYWWADQIALFFRPSLLKQTCQYSIKNEEDTQVFPIKTCSQDTIELIKNLSFNIRFNIAGTEMYLDCTVSITHAALTPVITHLDPFSWEALNCSFEYFKANKSDERFMLLLLSKISAFLPYSYPALSKEFFKYLYLYTNAVHLKALPPLFDDRNYVSTMVSADAENLQYAPLYQNDEKICNMALCSSKNGWMAIKYAHKRFSSDQVFAIAAIRLNPRAYIYASEELMSQEVVWNAFLSFAARKQELNELEFIRILYELPNELKRAIFLKTIIDHSDSFNNTHLYTSDFINDRLIMLELLKKWPNEIRGRKKLADDDVLMQAANVTNEWLCCLLFGLALSKAVMAIGILILTGMVTSSLPPVIAGSLALGGLIATGFFAVKTIQHQMAVKTLIAEGKLDCERTLHVPEPAECKRLSLAYNR